MLKRLGLLAITALMICAPAARADGLADPYTYWLLASSDDGQESFYLRQAPFTKDGDTGMVTVRLLDIVVGDQVKDSEYGTWLEDQFDCAHGTFSTKYVAYFNAEGVQDGIINHAQDELIFTPIVPGRGMDIAYGVARGTMDPRALPVNENRTVTQLIDDQFAAYGKVYKAQHGS